MIWRNMNFIHLNLDIDMYRCPMEIPVPGNDLPVKVTNSDYG